eukprot:5244947-Pleurochrysis_carterae.AAC.1
MAVHCCWRLPSRIGAVALIEAAAQSLSPPLARRSLSLPVCPSLFVRRPRALAPSLSFFPSRPPLRHLSFSSP